MTTRQRSLGRHHAATTILATVIPGVFLLTGCNAAIDAGERHTTADAVSGSASTATSSSFPTSSPTAGTATAAPVVTVTVTQPVVTAARDAGSRSKGEAGGGEVQLSVEGDDEPTGRELPTDDSHGDYAAVYGLPAFETPENAQAVCLQYASGRTEMDLVNAYGASYGVTGDADVAELVDWMEGSLSACVANNPALPGFTPLSTVPEGPPT